MNPHTPKWAPTLGIGVPMDSQIFKGRLQGSKFIGLRSSLYHWKVFGTQMSKMGLHDLEGYTLLQTSYRSEVCRRSYGLPKLRESQFWEFRDSNLGVLGQNDIWMLALWLGTENIIRGKVVASSKSRLWWILWIHVCPWLVCALKMFQLCINQLVVWFVQVHVSNWLACHSSYSPS
jgi:hypothetical protein